MNVGDYVRVNTKTMIKYVGITRLESETDFAWYFKDLTILKRPDRRSKKVVDINEFNYKSSPNIIELLEPMDLLYIDIDGGFAGGIVVPKIPETLNELNGFVEFIKSGHWILKSIVTHEQLENDMYNVGE